MSNTGKKSTKSLHKKEKKPRKFDKSSEKPPRKRTSSDPKKENSLHERLRKKSDDNKRKVRKEFFTQDNSSLGEKSEKKTIRIELARKNRTEKQDINRQNHSPHDEGESSILQQIVQRRRETGRSVHRPKVLSLAWSEERGLIRLNKYIANSGICSRREADDLIIAGAVTVNGKIVCELGTKVHPTDEVRYEDKILQREKPVYILLNKPKDYITTTSDERDRKNVMMLIEGACSQRVYPVGRLDRTTTGLLLLTNDGELTKRLTHPHFEMKKIYQVDLDKEMQLSDFEKLYNGLDLEDGFMKPDELAFVDGQRNVLGITLHSGRNRIVRRLFSHLGYEVVKLDRVYYAGLTKKDLPRGSWRFLTQAEINILKMST
jgi:23S rRNA pseudouridine2605 synthase